MFGYKILIVPLRLLFMDCRCNSIALHDNEEPEKKLGLNQYGKWKLIHNI